MVCRSLAVVAAAVFVTTAAATVRAQVIPAGATTALLDVPYIQQSEALCGGAAAAMVMRYWGAAGVYAETFSPLVDAAAGGIRGDTLLSELRRRGWDAHSFRGDPQLVRARLADRQPVVALIEDRPGVFHFVVIVAWTNRRVVVHDPARAPFRVIDETTFDRAWEKSDRWTLLALPGDGLKGARPSADAAESGTTAASPCSSLVEGGVRSAGEGSHAEALRMFGAAADLCPGDSSPWREMAGVYAIQKEWPKAVAYAREAVGRDIKDAHAWRILATGSFVTGDSASALDAWNHVGEPLIDLATIRGLERTRHHAAADLMALKPQALLTSGALAAANRRLDELPAAQTARVTYRPLEKGQAAVDAVVVERPRAPTSPGSIALVAARTVTDREVRGWLSNPTGAGDLIIASWRWWANRPRIGIAYATPTRVGVMRIDAFRDEQTYETPTADGGRLNAAEVRNGGSLTLSNWTDRHFRWELGGGFDSWGDRGRTVSLTVSGEQRLVNDRIALRASANAFGGSFTAWTWGGAVEWRSSARHERHVLLSRAGFERASTEAPRAAWPGAGSGHARTLLLRAHPLLDNGVVTGEVFGRDVYHAGAEWRRWFKPGLRILPIAPAAFVDVARSEKRLRPGAVWHADAGGGVRIAVPGSGVLRVDLAKGLRDGATAFSVAWTR